MSFVLGIDLGTTFTGVAVARSGGSDAMVSLGRRRHVMPSVVWLGPDGDIAVGERAVRRLATDPANVASLFKHDVGSEVPWRLGGRDVSVEELLGHVFEHVVTSALETQGGPAERVALTFPASWGPLRQGALVAGASSAGIDDPLLVTEPEAAAAFYASERPVPTDALVAVFDFGGGTLDVAVLHRMQDGFELLGTPVGDDELGGSNIDELVFDHVLDQLDEPTRDELDHDLAARASLYSECVEAKEALSFDAEAEIACATASGRRLVRLTRDELDVLIAPLVGRAVEVLRAGLDAAAVGESELHSVLLVGGTSRIPLVEQQLAAALPCAIAVDTDPKTSVALGAAKLAMADVRGTSRSEMLGDEHDLGIEGLGPATLIGRGAYSVVYRARQESLDRNVAVKLITGAGLDLTARRRFEQECQAIGRLSEHPNIVNVYQSGTPDDRPAFLVMSYVPGGSFQDEIEAGRRLPWRDAVEVAGKVAGALQAAHDANIYHCDVKPANVLLSPHREPLLADFGLARVAERTGTQSITGIAGTPHYSPPEVFDGAAPTPERDVYGLAATTHALIAGHPPIDVDSESILALMRHVASDPPEDLRPHGVPGPVADVIATALSKAPEDRYHSAAEFAAALESAALAAGRSDDAGTPPADDAAVEPAAPRRWWHDRRLLGAVGAVAVIILLVLLVTRPWTSDDARPAPTVPQTAPTSATLADTTTPGTSAPTTAPPSDGESIAYTTATESARFTVSAQDRIDGGVFEAIDGLGFDADTERLLALRDPAPAEIAAAEPDRAQPELFWFDVVAGGEVTPIGPLVGPDGVRYGNELDVEGLALLDDGTFFVVSEGAGELDSEAGPFVHRFDAAGEFVGQLQLPQLLARSDDGRSGAQQGRGPHGIARNPDEPSEVVVILEAPLEQDRDTGGRVVRLFGFDVTTGVATREWGYELDAAAPGVTTAVVDMTAIDDRSIVVMERQGFAGGATRLLYRIELDDGVEPGGDAPPPVEKQLVGVVAEGDPQVWSSLSQGPEDASGNPTLVLMTNSAHESDSSEVLVLELAAPATAPAVPSVAGLSESAATSVINESGIDVALIEHIADDAVADGVVLALNPPPGTRASQVKLTVSSGPTNDEYPIGLGSTGGRAERIEIWLTEIGLGGNLTPGDRTYDVGTEAAVREWQRSTGRPVTGTIDRESYLALRAEADSNFRPEPAVGCIDPDCENEFVQVSGDIAVYGISDGERRIVLDRPTMECLGGFDQIRLVDSATLDRFTFRNLPLTCDDA